MTPQELSGYLRVSKSTIYKLASAGQLPGFKIGDSWRFERGEILKLMRGERIGKETRNTKGMKGDGRTWQSREAGPKGPETDGQAESTEVGLN